MLQKDHDAQNQTQSIVAAENDLQPFNMLGTSWFVADKCDLRLKYELQGQSTRPSLLFVGKKSRHGTYIGTMKETFLCNFWSSFWLINSNGFIDTC